MWPVSSSTVACTEATGSSHVSRWTFGKRAKEPVPGSYSILLFHPVWVHKSGKEGRREGGKEGGKEGRREGRKEEDSHFRALWYVTCQNRCESRKENVAHLATRGCRWA